MSVCSPSLQKPDGYLRPKRCLVTFDLLVEEERGLHLIPAKVAGNAQEEAEAQEWDQERGGENRREKAAFWSPAGSEL